MAETLVTNARLVAMYENTSHPVRALGVPMVLVGHGQACEVFLGSSSVARAHAIMVCDFDRFTIRDLVTKELTKVNNEQIEEAELKPDDTMEFGRFVFRLDVPEPRPLPEYRRVQASVIGSDGSETPLERVVSVIGRREGSDVRIEDEEASRVNSCLVRTSYGLFIRDLDSRLGTFVDGHNVRMAQLRDGQELVVGETKLTVRIQNTGSLQDILGI